MWRLLNIIVADAGQTPVTLCGELAGREEMIPRLLASGVRALSMAPPLIPTAKERIRNMHLGPAPGAAVPEVARIAAAELRVLLASGQPVTVLDARSTEAWDANGVRIPGAVRLGDDGLRVDPAWPRARLTVVYCTCPCDAGAAAVVGELRARGFSRAAVLRGGFEAWEAAGGPVEAK